MLTRYALLLLLAASATATTAAAAEQARLTIGKETYNVPLGKPFALRLGGQRTTMRIDPLNDRAFAQAGVAFRYPTDFEASESGDKTVKIWTLQGPNAAVMLQQYEPGLDPKSLLEVMSTNLAETAGGEPKKQAVKLTGPERAYQGLQLRTKSPAAPGRPATQSVQNLFTFANERGVFALMIQDVGAPGADPSAEYNEALRLLGESLKTGKPPAEKKPEE